ncbi:universal stress protein [Mycolicibacterium thermoresistibile]|jgi:nucleotide-binding universal stress UspA family protein
MAIPAIQDSIVAGVDGSPSSAAAVEWAARNAALRDRPLVLVHVVPSPMVTTAPWPQLPLPDDAFRVMQEEGERLLAQARAAAEQAGAGEVRTAVLQAGIVGTLTELSRDADRIVVGSRGQTALGRMLLGSVSTGLVHQAECPVVIVRDGDQPPGDAPVLVGIDGSPASELATEVAFEEASVRQVELVALHGWRDTSLFHYPGLDTESLQTQAEAVLAERLAGWQERYPDVTVRRVVVAEHPARALVQRAEEAQLVVVGSRGRGGLTGKLLGSVSTGVVHSVRVPVMVARPR